MRQSTTRMIALAIALALAAAVAQPAAANSGRENGSYGSPGR